jgi:hypothetical protein
MLVEEVETRAGLQATPTERLGAAQARMLVAAPSAEKPFK